MKKIISTLLLASMVGLITPSALAHGEKEQCGFPYFKGSEDAGFVKAKGSSINEVESVTITRSDNFLAVYGLHYWNIIAGWELLKFVDDPNADIRVVDGRYSATWWSSEAPYEYAKVQFVTWEVNPSFYGWTTGPHEFAHALGFCHLKKGVTANRHFDQRFDFRALKAGGYFVENW